MRQTTLHWLGRATAWCAIAASGYAQAPAPVSFNAPREFPGGTAGVVVADFNGDGKADLATINNYNSDNLSILLGNGDGSFQTGATYTFISQSRPTSVAVGDFNHDGKMDLVVTADHDVGILLGNGDGTFQKIRNYFAGGSALGVAVGDFNGDGIPDLAVANYSYDTVAVLTGNGDGSFGPAVIFPVGVLAVFVAVGDFNGDGKLDLAVANAGTRGSGSISILLGTGTGDFQPAINYASGSIQAIVVGDFNGDGKLDLAAAQYIPGNVSIMLGNGDGTFQPRVDYGVGGSPGVLATGDYNGDGKLDLAANTGTILLGNGDGTFRHASRPFQPAETVSVFAVGDFNSDGKLDLAAANGHGIVILLGSGHATFQRPVTYAAPGGAVSDAVGDFNGDGILDLAVPNQTNVSILLGNGHGAFQAVGSYSAGGYPTSAAVADFNGDGKLDLAVVNNVRDTGGVSVLLGNGDGSFQPPLSYQSGDFPSSVIVADFNGDGKPDLLVNESYDLFFAIFLGNGDGTFQPALKYNLSGFASISVGDFNRDGKPDLAVASGRNDGGIVLSILLGKGNGTFRSGVSYNVPGAISFAADLNGDKELDLVLSGASSTWVMLGNGDGTFQTPLTMNFGTGPVAAADFNGDGKVDLATVGALGAGIAVGNGDGTFEAPVYFNVGSLASTLAIGDFNRDGRPDLAVPNTSAGVSILTNTTK